MKPLASSEHGYKRHKEKEKIDREIVEDIAKGIKDILSGKIKAV